LVFDGPEIDEVLQSLDNSADPPLKKRFLSRFTVRGVIISRGADWEKRRALNTDALAFGCPRHPSAEEFREIVEGEVHGLLERRPQVLAWGDFSELAARISQQVILGQGEFKPELAEHLARLIAWSNLGFRRRPPFFALYQRINDHLGRQSTRKP